MLPPQIYKALVLMKGKKATTITHLCDVSEHETTHRTYEETAIFWPTLPKRARPHLLAINPSRKEETLWLVLFPELPQDFLANVTYADVRDLITLYTTWTGTKPPEDWSKYLAFEISA